MIDATGLVAARDQGERVEVGVAKATSTWRPRCAPTSTCSVSASIARRTTCFLPGRGNGRRKLSDAEIVTLCVAQVLMGIPSDRRFLRAADGSLRTCFPVCRARTLAQAATAADRDDRVADRGRRGAVPRLPTTISCCSTRPRSSAAARSRRHAAPQLAEVCGYGYCKSHSRWFWGHETAPGLRPRRHPEGRHLRRGRPTRTRGRAADCWPRALHGGETIVCDKGYAGREFAEAVARWAARSSGPPAKTNPTQASTSPDPAADRVRLLHLQRPAQPRTPRRPTPPNLRARIATRLLASPPASDSTTNSDDPAAQSPTTPPNPWHQC